MLLVLDCIRFSLKKRLNSMQYFQEMSVLKYTVPPIVPIDVFLNGKKMFRRSTIK